MSPALATGFTGDALALRVDVAPIALVPEKAPAIARDLGVAVEEPPPHG